MKKSRIFVFEFVSGGGFNKIEIPLSLFCEGFAMLKSIIADFKEIGFEVNTLLDYRINWLTQYLKMDYIVQVDKHVDYTEKFKEVLKDCEYCFIIAPEFSNILFHLTKIAKNMNKKILSVDLNGIKLGSSKIETYEFFKTSNVKTPVTFLIPKTELNFDFEFIFHKFNEIKKPIIIKPDDGVGAESIYLIEKKEQLVKFYRNWNKYLDVNRNYIIQEFIRGEDLSVSLIRTNNYRNLLISDEYILSINAQLININKLKNEWQYLGGYTPIENHKQIKELIQPLLKKLDLTTFHGYFGIDFIKDLNNNIHFIEINPRLTTSYIGIRNTLNLNPVELILNPDNKSFQQNEIDPHLFSKFFHLELKYFGDYTIEEIYYQIIPKLISNIPEIVTPPITFTEQTKKLPKTFFCFIATKTKDLNSTKKRINQILKTFKEYDFFV